MKRTTIFADQDTLQELKRIAYQQWRPLSTVIREALAEYAASHRPSGHRFSFTEMFESETGDLSERVDELLGEILKQDYQRQHQEFAEDLKSRGKQKE